MRDTKACRACLNTAGKLDRISDNWYRMFENLSGVQANKNDGYPNYFCVECKSHLNKAIAFRKKARRAYYILQEIMMVRKEVTLPDIQTVNRSTANLKSHLDMWEPGRYALYTMSDLEEAKQDLVKQEAKVIQSSVIVRVIDDDDVDDVSLDDHPPELHDEVNLEPVEQDADVKEEAEEPKEPEEDIDMEDVFKGLKEPESESSEEEIAPPPPLSKEKKKKKKKEDVSVKKPVPSERNTKAKSLVYYEIKRLTEEEQRGVFQMRCSNPKFRSALYTCGICVKILPHTEAMMNHFNAHISKGIFHMNSKCVTASLYFKCINSKFGSALYTCGICVKILPHVEAMMNHFNAHISKVGASILCKVCKDKFVTDEELEQHIQESHLYQYTCKICSDIVYSIRDVVKHRKEKHVERRDMEIEAEMMDKFLIIPLSEEQKVENMKKLSKSGNYTCGLCHMAFCTNETYKKHVRQHEYTPGLPKLKIQCTICSLWLKSRNVFEQHMENYHNYNYHCKTCSYEAQNRFLAEDHMARLNCTGINKCQYCDRNSNFSHQKQEHWCFFYKHPCVACGTSFRTLYGLYRHQLKLHKYIKLAEPPAEGAENACEQCRVQFLSQRAYWVHVVKARHDTADCVPLKCLSCRKVFDTEAEWTRHTDIHRTSYVLKSFPGPCNLCGDVMETPLQYFRHCMKEHPKYDSLSSKRRLCPTCGKTYKNKCPCARKRTRERAVKKYKCSLCEITFDKAKGVVFHVLKKHTKDPFVCTICTKKFRRRYDCKDHILKIHAPVRPYTCPICNRDFSHLDFLKKHAKGMHDVKVELETKVKTKKKFYLYPNMKVDLSLIDKKVIDDVKIEVADYTDQIFEVLDDYSDYVITNEDVIKSIDEKHAAAEKRRRLELEEEEF